MPKINWEGADEDALLTAEDIDQAEDGRSQYTGDMPPGGVYRFTVARAKFQEFTSGNQGLNVLLRLDGSWKREHKKYDDCPLWHRVVMTKGAASFVKAFCAAIGVSGEDLISRVVVDEDGYVTKIGKVKFDDNLSVYVAVKRGSYEGEPRLEVAGTGFQLVEEGEDNDDSYTPAKKATAAKKAAKSEVDADEDDAPRGKPSKASGKKARPADDEDEPPF